VNKRKKDPIEYIERFLEDDYEGLKKNLESLLKDYQRKNRRLDKIILQSDKQQKKLLQLNEQLEEYQNHLEQKVEEEIKKRKAQELILFQQSKLAAMGEMIDAVAHQWKQPINLIKMNIDFLSYDLEDGKIDKNYIEEFQNKSFAQIEHINNTLSEFRDFLRPDKPTKEFSVAHMIDKVLILVKDELLKHSINIEKNIKNDFTIDGIENEFKHLVLNIINNAKDAFDDNQTKNKKITISIFETENEFKIEFTDNAGGIPKNILENIFKANITSKPQGKGTGIGLYMSSQIAEKHNGTLQAENIKNGANFTFSLLKNRI